MTQIERGGAEWQRRVQMLLQQQAEHIKEHGYTVQRVFPTEEGNHYFAYTAGLFLKDWPELLVFGNLDAASLSGVISSVYEYWLKEGRAVVGDIPVPAIPGGRLCVNLVRREEGQKYATGVRSFKGDNNYMVAQVLWPDNAGKLPDEEGYDLNISQHVLEMV